MGDIRSGAGAGRRDVARLFEGDSVAGLDEGELLERFATRRDEARRRSRRWSGGSGRWCWGSASGC